jgi:hypothetical protein
MLKISEGLTAEISKDIIQKSLLSEARRARADFRSGNVYEDLAVKVYQRFIKRHLIEWVTWPSSVLVGETCTQARGLRIDKLRMELEEKLRKEQEIIDLKENYAKMHQELAEMKKKVEES